MTKQEQIEEIKNIAMWEETDSELAKYKIQALNELVNSYKKQNQYLEASIKNIEQVNKELFDRIDKAIEYIERTLKDDHSEFMYMGEPDIILDILRGEDEK